MYKNIRQFLLLIEFNSIVNIFIQRKNKNYLTLEYNIVLRGYSSVGRALEWHSRGQRFKSA